MSWSFTKPEISGWYWITYFNYEKPEVVYFNSDDDTIYCVGIEGTKSTKTIQLWHSQALEWPKL